MVGTVADEIAATGAEVEVIATEVETAEDTTAEDKTTIAGEVAATETVEEELEELKEDREPATVKSTQDS